MAEEKHDEKEEKEEKGRDEKWQRDPLNAIAWAAILIWAGLALLADNMGLLVRCEGLEAWSLIFMGAGLIVLAEAAIRLLVPEYRRPVTGSLIFGVILFAIGLGDVVNWGVVWALVLIVIGVGVLLRSLLPGR